MGRRGGAQRPQPEAPAVPGADVNVPVWEPRWEPPERKEPGRAEELNGLERPMVRVSHQRESVRSCNDLPVLLE